jgi:flagellar basal-body rod protein FlgC
MKNASALFIWIHPSSLISLISMSLFTILQISSQGMTAQRERLEAASTNLANAHSTRTSEGGPYRRRDILFETVALQQSNSLSDAPTGSLFATPAAGLSQGVQATTELASPEQFIRRFEPGHPDADADGYVKLPDVDPLEETVNMISAARSFEANATAFNTAKELARATLKLGES